MSKKTKSAKDQLASGAEKIKKAQKELKGKTPQEPIVIPESTRPIEDILRDQVTVLPGSIGLQFDDNTPIEETLRVLDWTTTLSDHVGFMIGDVINFGMVKFGDKYKAALNQTGRAYSTLAGYAETARRIGPSNRVATLSFSHHREVLRIGNDEKIAATLKEVGAQAEKGNAPTIKELRFKVQKLTPRKIKKPKKATSGKSKKTKDKPEAPAYQPDADESARMDAAEESLSAAADAIKAGGVYKIVAKCDNKEKKRWLQLAEPIVTFYNALDKVTGY